MKAASDLEFGRSDRSQSPFKVYYKVKENNLEYPCVVISMCCDIFIGDAILCDSV